MAPNTARASYGRGVLPTPNGQVVGTFAFGSALAQRHIFSFPGVIHIQKGLQKGKQPKAPGSQLSCFSVQGKQSSAMNVEVCLPSGRACTLQLAPDSRGEALKRAAQRHFQLPFLRLTLEGPGQHGSRKPPEA